MAGVHPGSGPNRRRCYTACTYICRSLFRADHAGAWLASSLLNAD